jgi:short-subunit dehydrogenase
VDFADRVVVVTGASSGIGGATARAFARRGAIVVGVARRADRLQEVIDACRADSPQSSFLVGDLAQRSFAERIVADVVARHGGLDGLVNNAGVAKHRHVCHLSADEVEYVMRVNFLAPVWTTLAALPVLLARGGGFIVNVSSFAAKVVPPRETAYAASKAALSGFTEGLWSDLAGSGVHAALIHAGPIDTEIWDHADEPVAYAGPRHAPDRVATAILEAVERRRYERVVPRRSLPLATARMLRLVAPALLRRGLTRLDPVPAALLESARERGRSGRSGGG